MRSVFKLDRFAPSLVRSSTVAQAIVGTGTTLHVSPRMSLIALIQQLAFRSEYQPDILHLRQLDHKNKVFILFRSNSEYILSSLSNSSGPGTLVTHAANLPVNDFLAIE